MKWVGMPIWSEAREHVFADAVVESRPCRRIVPFFSALNAVASSLKYWISVPGSGPS